MKGSLRRCLLALVLVHLAGCSHGPHARSEPLPLGATSALARARSFQRSRPDGWQDGARQAAELAAQLAPDWVAPRRVLDDLDRERLLAHEALGRHLARLEVHPDDAAELYLAGRLEGRSGIARIERAAAQEPGLSWARHGVAWNRFLDGNARGALREGRRALELARGSHELATFGVAEARYLLELERVDDAVQLLEDLLRDARLDEPERTECRVWLARSELAGEERERIERGFWRAAELFADPGLSVEEREGLGDDVFAKLSGVAHPEARAVLEEALGAGHPGSARLLARLYLERGADSLATALLERAELESAAPPPLLRLLALERGDGYGAIERWRSELPARVLDSAGLPVTPALRALVASAASSRDPGGAAEFGRALIAAGWFAEAGAWATALARLDGAAGLALDRQASAGRSLLGGIRSVLDRIDHGEPVVTPELGRRPAKVASLDDLLRALQPYFERFHALREDAPPDDLSRSPVLLYGSLAAVVHPGPTFSETDERSGLGVAGDAVPGLARELARIGRFGIFGKAPGGGGPDGALLRLLATEWRTGNHLGVPFAGLVAWCEGTDVPSRPARAGSAVSGAALHEGYWIDIEGVRREAARVRALEREHVGSDSRELDELLLSRGPHLPPGAQPEVRERWQAPLGEGERVLLAVLSERARAGLAEGERVTLDELLDTTALHEEGHLTDRTRFLPLVRHWGRALRFALRAGLTPRSIARELEYRAQLVALCAASDPRLVLADCLSAADEVEGVLPHGDAYRGLIEDLLELVGGELDELPALDPQHYLVYQLHFLGPEELRRLAVRLAERNDMVEDR